MFLFAEKEFTFTGEVFINYSSKSKMQERKAKEYCKKIIAEIHKIAQPEKINVTTNILDCTQKQLKKWYPDMYEHSKIAIKPL